ncbi:hypothetical protein ACFUJR_22845 [Streptomyces sp. NPDC057271]|uniref:hypothetical protein n=1 Tax=Streptomyces sp. NPDC057271 TaxID=3346078 RepID=UPI00362BE350
MAPRHAALTEHPRRRDLSKSTEPDGRKLRGGRSLTRLRTDTDGGRPTWLPVTRSAERASGGGTPDPRRARSVRTGHTPGQVAAGRAA